MLQRQNPIQNPGYYPKPRSQNPIQKPNDSRAASRLCKIAAQATATKRKSSCPYADQPIGDYFDIDEDYFLAYARLPMNPRL
jgi:hypothetical protein